MDGPDRKPGTLGPLSDSARSPDQVAGDRIGPSPIQPVSQSSSGPDRDVVTIVQAGTPASLSGPGTGTRTRDPRVSGAGVFSSLPLLVLSGIFVAAAAVVWFAGIQLSETTDILSQRWGLGSALGGLILLAVATNLPEIAIVVSAGLSGNTDVAIGNILGGIAIQTIVLSMVDAAVSRKGQSLTYRAASLVLVLEGLTVMAVLAVVVMGSQLPAALDVGRVELGAVAIVVTWAVGLWLVREARNGLPWHHQGDAPGGQETQATTQSDTNGRGTGKATLVFAAAAAATLVAGFLLERSGDVIAGDIGMTGVIFGATVLAAATSLPELSTGIASARNGDDQLAVSDIFGGNAFLPVLFLPLGLLTGSAVLPAVQGTNLYLTALGIVLTMVFLVGVIFRSRRRVLRMGLDSLMALVVYAVGILGLLAIQLLG